MSQQHYLNRSAYDVIIGIDPDVDKSGVAIKYKELNGYVTNHSLSICQLRSFLESMSQDERRALVIIEASWLNITTNYHYKGVEKSAKIREYISWCVGRNHQVGFTIVQFCEELGLDYFLQKPTQTKKTKTFLKKNFGIIAKNQEEVDAVMLVL